MLGRSTCREIETLNEKLRLENSHPDYEKLFHFLTWSIHGSPCNGIMLNCINVLATLYNSTT